MKSLSWRRKWRENAGTISETRGRYRKDIRGTTFCVFFSKKRSATNNFCELSKRWRRKDMSKKECEMNVADKNRARRGESELGREENIWGTNAARRRKEGDKRNCLERYTRKKGANGTRTCQASHLKKAQYDIDSVKSQDLKKVKQAILKRYSINEETYQQRFTRTKKKREESYAKTDEVRTIKRS